MRDGSIPALPSRALKGEHMSYYATIDGAFEISREFDLDILLEKIQSSHYSESIEIISEDAAGYTLVFNCYANYREDEIAAFLKLIEPNTISGEIEYIGEDNAFWRHYFDPSKKRWVEQSGHISYEKRCVFMDSLLEHCKNDHKTGDDAR